MWQDRRYGQGGFAKFKRVKQVQGLIIKVADISGYNIMTTCHNSPMWSKWFRTQLRAFCAHVNGRRINVGSDTASACLYSMQWHFMTKNPNLERKQGFESWKPICLHTRRPWIWSMWSANRPCQLQLRLRPTWVTTPRYVNYWKFRKLVTADST